ncbi:MAG: YtxH domain-containing protein [Anaerolineae bacterium]
MLRNIADFVRGFVFGLVVGGSAGMLLAPESGEKTQSTLQARIEATKAAFEEGRAQAEKELLEYFEQSKRP